MKGKLRALAASLIVVLAVGVAILSTAKGSGEPEDPFWKVSAKRLESGTSKKATIKNAPGVETVLHGQIKNSESKLVEAEVKCKSSAFSSAQIEGSAAKDAGKASGTLELSECKLFAEESEKFVEQKKCEIPNIKSKKLSGGLWLEGTKAAKGGIAVVVLEPESGSEVAKVVINGTECSYKGSPVLEGSFAAKLLPQNEEFTYMRWVLPPTAITTVWRPPSEEAEKTIGLKMEGHSAALVGEMQPELELKEEYGGGTGPVAGIEAPFWAVKKERLELEKEEGLESGTATGAATFVSKIKGSETETRCPTIKISGKFLGSERQRDGKFDIIIEFSGCKIFVKESEKFVEKTSCEVSPITTNHLTGRLWYAGSKEARGTEPFMLAEPETMTEGKPVLMEESVKNKGMETCPVAEEKYRIEGALPAKLGPKNKQVKELKFVVEIETELWQSAEQEAKQKPVIKHGEETVVVKVPEIPIKPTKGGEIGVGENPTSPC